MAEKKNKISELEQVMKEGSQTRFWREIRGHLEQRIDILRSELEENEGLPDAENRRLKAKLAVYRYLLAAPEIIASGAALNESRGDDSDPYE